RQETAVNQAGGSDRISAVGGPPPREVGQPPARRRDQDQRGGQVPGVEFGLYHCLARTLGHQGITPEVAEATVAPGRADNRVEPLLPPDRLERRARRVEDLRVFYCRHPR